MSVKESYVIAVDLGTSGPKAALVTLSGRVLASVFEPVRIQLFPDGGAEQEPRKWWAATVKAIRQLLSQEVAPLDSIAAIGVTAQFCSMVALGADGNPVMNAVIWMDSRGAEHVKHVTSGLINYQGYGLWKLFRWVSLTGGIPSHSGKDTIAHILWLKATRPELYRATFKFLEPKDYINYLLTGQVYCTSDSATSFWLTDNRDLDHVDYHPWLLAVTGIDRDKMPDIRRSIDVIGVLTPEVTQTLGLPRQIPVIGGAPDLHAAAIGSGAVNDYDGHLYVGTSSWISCHVPFKKTTVIDNIASIPSSIPGRYVVGNEQECAGACLTFLHDKVLNRLTATSDAPLDNLRYRVLDQLAANAPAGSDGIIFTPWLYGERTPVEDHSLRGGFFNLSLSSDRDRITRAVYEGVAYNSRWLLGAVERFIGRPFPSLRFIGGGANSSIWCQIFADVLDRPILQVADPSSAGLRGVALLTAIALGQRHFSELSSEVEVATTYTPDANHRAVYDKLFKAFLRLYKSNRALHSELNKNS